VRRFWSWLGLNLGKHWIIVLTTGAVLTVGLGLGISKLEFSTGQDSYLNKSDQVYKDSVAYQNLFGGQAMLTLVTMDKGHTVNELFSTANLAQWRAVEKQLRDSGRTVSVVSPVTALEYDDALVRSPSGDPTQSVAGQILVGAIARDKSAAGQTARNADAAKTLSRLTAIPAANRVLAADFGWATQSFVPPPPESAQSAGDLDALDDLWKPHASATARAYLYAALSDLMTRRSDTT
jgi:uncharacterized protein